MIGNGNYPIDHLLWVFAIDEEVLPFQPDFDIPDGPRVGWGRGRLDLVFEQLHQGVGEEDPGDMALVGFDLLSLVGRESQVLLTVAKKNFYGPPISISLDDLHGRQVALVGDQIGVGIFGLFVSGRKHLLEGLGFRLVFDAHQGQDEGNLLDKDRPSTRPTPDLGIMMVYLTPP